MQYRKDVQCHGVQGGCAMPPGEKEQTGADGVRQGQIKDSREQWESSEVF